MKTLIISCSYNPKSRSRVLAEAAKTEIEAVPGGDVELIDLRDYPLPHCDGAEAYGDANVPVLGQKIEEADAVVLAVPIYNYDVNAAAKNLIELAGRKMSEKPVGFLCAAGGDGSYMSVMSVANSLMLDFHCLIVPRFVYATGEHFDDANQIVDEDVMRRIRQFAKLTCHLAESYRPNFEKD